MKLPDLIENGEIHATQDIKERAKRLVDEVGLGKR
jgi:hypothetical protein